MNFNQKALAFYKDCKEYFSNPGYEHGCCLQLHLTFIPFSDKEIRKIDFEIQTALSKHEVLFPTNEIRLKFINKQIKKYTKLTKIKKEKK